MMDVLHTSNNNSVLSHTIRKHIPQQQSTMNHTNQLPSLSSFSLNLTSGTNVPAINANRDSPPISSITSSHQPSFTSSSNGLNSMVKRENEGLPMQSSTSPPLLFASSRLLGFRSSTDSQQQGNNSFDTGHILAKPAANNVSLPPIRSIFQEIPEYTDSTNRYFTTGNQYNQYNNNNNNASQISRNSSHSSVAGTMFSNSQTFDNSKSVSLQQGNSLPSPQSISTSPPPPVFPHNINKSNPSSTSSSNSSLPPLNQVLMFNYDNGSSTAVDNGINRNSSISSAAHALESLHRGINRTPIQGLRENNLHSNNENTDDSYGSAHNLNENNAHGKTSNLVRKYKCKTCLKSFTTSGHLARHTRIHTGERKHACPFEGCGARFSRQDNCMQHYKTHLNQSRRKSKLKKNSTSTSTSSATSSNSSKEQFNSIVTSGSDDDNELVHKSAVKK
ncbi:unnamed protein product [[Candida] boidinii]|uniref:Unnamed protein product n=1 Tax=Candida boidinii TaxID=5477 RepID=A0A9W6SU75_CANBO|nr:nucleic acid binding protein [[Candida] boidinii]GME67319.1 unnamed protein product [[Candida] boidinii]GME93474.1 unnamed protein product [[Candida] boidinii]GMF50736.1 unnamed protein product [[Candida] boidinii]